MTSAEVQENLVESVVDFTGASRERAKKLLEDSNWNVPEAVTRFFLEAEAVPSLTRPPAPVTPAPFPTSSMFSTLVMAVKSCMGWAWHACRWFLYGTSLRTGSGSLAGHLAALPEGVPRPLCLEETFQEVAARSRQRDNRKVLVVYLHSSLAESFEFATKNILCQESIVSVINEQFQFWAGDIECSGPSQLLRALPVRATPMLIAIVSMNATELKVVGACAGSGFSTEGIMGVLAKAHEAQDGLIAQDEQFRINRSLREDQDREYQDALERDRMMSEKRAEQDRALAEKAAALEAEQQSKHRRKEEAAERIKNLPEPTTPTTIVVRLPDGVRIERKFDSSDTVEVLYDWVLSCGVLHAHACEVAKTIHAERFTLSTSFPSRRLDNMQATLEAVELVPNAVLAFTRVGDDSETE